MRFKFTVSGSGFKRLVVQAKGEYREEGKLFHVSGTSSSQFPDLPFLPVGPRLWISNRVLVDGVVNISLFGFCQVMEDFRQAY